MFELTSDLFDPRSDITKYQIVLCQVSTRQSVVSLAQLQQSAQFHPYSCDPWRSKIAIGTEVPGVGTTTE